ncbi:MAG TPA: DNA polymerase III subunit gamma/tau, partial [Phaeodactylibacter sp.]|nr:DNA polymerase III subunit gamma/tau [Phaeodactylibacter sp.]
RPIRFDEVVGQQHVSQTLKNALQNDHLAHAFLFCGPRGVGKTTCARILAKVLNCQNRTADFEPCDECDSCKAFNGNASFNITELDAASNNSVEHIRTLVEQVRFQPQQGEYKVFIIDEVHMLSQAAFNAFLKTLEEPPPYAIFILATTEKHKIIPTILSRCQIFDFKRIQVQEMVAHLQGICKTESIEADKDALHIIAQKADGALRDALSIFDRIVSSLPASDAGKKITYDDVITNLNVLDYDYFFKMTDALLVEDITQFFLIFDKIQKNGFEADMFINGLAEHFRNILVCKDAKTLQLLEVSDTLKQRYQQQAKITPTSFLLSALNIANDCDVNYKMARNKRLHVEIALTKMAYINRATSNIYQNIPTGVVEKKVEKKTTDSTVLKEKQNTYISPPPTTTATETATETPSEPAASPVQKVVSPVATPTNISTSPPPPKEEKKATPASNVKLGGLALSSKHNLFKIPSKGELESQVAQDDVQEEARESKLNQENLEKVWKDYYEAVTSPSAKNILKNATLSIVNEDLILVTVGSIMAQNTVQLEYDLMSFIRKKLTHPKLMMETKVDTSKLPIDPTPKPLKLSTPKEKYEKLIELNPLVTTLIQRFDLKVDK